MGQAKRNKERADYMGWNKKRKRFVHLMKLISNYSDYAIETFLHNRIKEGRL